MQNGKWAGALQNDGQEAFLCRGKSTCLKEWREEFWHQTISLHGCEIKENGDKTRKELRYRRRQRQTEAGFKIAGRRKQFSPAASAFCMCNALCENKENLS